MAMVEMREVQMARMKRMERMDNPARPADRREVAAGEAAGTEVRGVESASASEVCAAAHVHSPPPRA